MRLFCLDTETTGIDVFEDRIVTFFGGILEEDGTFTNVLDLMIDPGVPIPDGAAEVHGVTTEIAQAEGVPAEQGIKQIALYIAHIGRDLPMVIMNANYDLSILEAEFERHGLGGFSSGWTQLVFDPRVMDLHHDKWRKGKRKLVNLAATYGVLFEGEKAHNAEYDCYLAGNVTKAIIAKYGTPTNDEQAEWYRDWAASFEKYLQKNDPTASVVKDWPLRLKEKETTND